jgi:ABC-type Fe3+-hydroxamate transport system substrate-binding protein
MLLVIAVVGILLTSCSSQSTTNASTTNASTTDASTTNASTTMMTTNASTTRIVTTEPVPTQPPFAKGEYTLTKDGETCLNITMAASFLVQYEREDDVRKDNDFLMLYPNVADL